MKKLILFLVLVIFGCTSIEPVSTCTSEVPESKWTTLDQSRWLADVQAIDDYLSANNLLASAIKHESGVRVVIDQFGSGENIPCTENVIRANYTGKLFSNFTIFDSSTNGQFVILLSSLITGWQIGFLEINKGTKASIFIPSGLAYGEQSFTTSTGKNVPANSIMVFDIEFLDWR